MIDQLANKNHSMNHIFPAYMKSTHTIQERKHFPKWLRKPVPTIGKKNTIEKYLQKYSLHTVCKEAKCPNRNECFSRGTATLLIMGDICTRNCLFCSVNNGQPSPLNSLEPENVCTIVKKMNLSYIVLTSVTRDDLSDGGAGHFADTVAKLRQNIPKITIEVLVPDFNGCLNALDTVIESKPNVFNHNIETVSRVFSQIRPEANYERSLCILKQAAQKAKGIPIKSGFMVGLGETENEVFSLLKDLKDSQVTIITIGQYLQPSKKQVPVKEFITPEQFNQYQLMAKELGFKKIFSGPYVRSSYKAEQSL